MPKTSAPSQPKTAPTSPSNQVHQEDEPSKIPKKKDWLRPCIPLVPVKRDKAQKIDLFGVKFRFDPTDVDSEVYDKTNCKLQEEKRTNGSRSSMILVEVWPANDRTQPLHQLGS